MEGISQYLWVWILGMPFVIAAVELVRTRRLINRTVRDDDERTTGILRPARAAAP